MRLPLIAGNWKMYKTTAEARAFAAELRQLYDQSKTDVQIAICAPFTQLAVLQEALVGSGIGVGAQNVHFAQEGAYTGEVSIPMLREIGVDYCIVGHSERRQYFGETDETVNLKLKALLQTEIVPILCVGENLAQREAGQASEVVRRQVELALSGLAPEAVSRMVIAYVPIWAIGTGKTASPQQANEMCFCVRQALIDIYDDAVADLVRIQYGGSVKPENVTEIMNMEEIDGALVGGASLIAAKFNEIVNF